MPWTGHNDCLSIEQFDLNSYMNYALFSHPHPRKIKFNAPHKQKMSQTLAEKLVNSILGGQLSQWHMSNFCQNDTLLVGLLRHNHFSFVDITFQSIRHFAIANRATRIDCLSVCCWCRCFCVCVACSNIHSAFDVVQIHRMPMITCNA